MQRRSLGDSNIKVSIVGHGTWAAGATEETWGKINDNESIATIRTALDCGINLIDTAPIYGLGHSEKIVGRAILGRRDEVVLATKCGVLFPRSDYELPPRSLNAESIIKECEQSLHRLRTDYIDLYQCHWPDPETPIEETFTALNQLLEQGKIRAIGVSNFNVEELDQARSFGPIHSVQPPFSMLHLEATTDLIPYCLEHNIAVLAYSPLAKGLLTGKFNTNSRFEDVRARDPEFQGDRFQRNLRVIEELRKICESYGKTLAQLVINWTLSFPGVTAPLVGAKRPAQLLETLGALKWTISDEDTERIDQILKSET